MLIVPEKFILLATPRTGSRGLEKTFIGGISTQWDSNGEPRPREERAHHVHPDDVDEVAEKFVPGSSKLPKYTICRNPVSQLRSWYHHVNVNHTDRPPSLSEFVTFIKEADIAWYFTPTLNPYQYIATEILPYMRDGAISASTISQKTGALIKTEPPVIGASVGLSTTWLTEPKVIEAVNGRFKRDVDLFKRVVDAWASER